ncbi:MAG: ABC transporter ATP-binding protein [Roseibium sp.]|nr:ABC transporter ATP-binding protein [Roseibium sp.]
MAFWAKGRSVSAAASFDLTVKTYAVFEAVSLALDGKTVLDGISLALSERRVGIVGLNGSGKSSLARLLNGLRLPTNGKVRLFGADTVSVAAQLPRHVGFVFQNPDHQAIFPTVEEEIAFGLTQIGHDRTSARAEAVGFLRRHRCEFLADKPIATLSEGQKQLVCILAVLVMQPCILVLDEPMTSLDGLAAKRILQKLQSLDQTLIMVSHDLSALTGFDRILWLEDGRIRMDGVPGDVLPAYAADLDRRAAAEVWEGDGL